MVRISGNYSQMASTFSFVNYRDSALNTLLSPIITLCWFGFDPHISMIWGLNPYHQRLYNIKKGPGYPSGFTTSKNHWKLAKSRGGLALCSASPPFWAPATARVVRNCRGKATWRSWKKSFGRQELKNPGISNGKWKIMGYQWRIMGYQWGIMG